MSVVDVPGHERFVRQMIAGSTGIDVALLCIAADDGIMPQTEEHLAVLQLSGLPTCVVALTKCDLVDEEWALFMEDEVRAAWPRRHMRRPRSFPFPPERAGPGQAAGSHQVAARAPPAAPSRRRCACPWTRSFTIRERNRCHGHAVERHRACRRRGGGAALGPANAHPRHPGAWAGGRAGLVGAPHRAEPERRDHRRRADRAASSAPPTPSPPPTTSMSTSPTWACPTRTSRWKPVAACMLPTAPRNATGACCSWMV